VTGPSGYSDRGTYIVTLSQSLPWQRDCSTASTSPAVGAERARSASNPTETHKKVRGRSLDSLQVQAATQGGVHTEASTNDASNRTHTPLPPCHPPGVTSQAQPGHTPGIPQAHPRHTPGTPWTHPPHHQGDVSHKDKDEEAGASLWGQPLGPRAPRPPLLRRSRPAGGWRRRGRRWRTRAWASRRARRSVSRVTSRAPDTSTSHCTGRPILPCHAPGVFLGAQSKGQVWRSSLKDGLGIIVWCKSRGIRA